ncbi:hypothetical protein C1H46_014739 [Malus baccata]|uniref:Uncharacterized protein n=1 Tax=Malus baccata TaxID=106549 RepID=A0A540MLD5_MALBA|nr:hypothetical protein C1H46_014739 [Malus baccata]
MSLSTYTQELQLELISSWPAVVTNLPFITISLALEGGKAISLVVEYTTRNVIDAIFS